MRGAATRSLMAAAMMAIAGPCLAQPLIPSPLLSYGPPEFFSDFRSATRDAIEGALHHDRIMRSRPRNDDNSVPIAREYDAEDAAFWRYLADSEREFYRFMIESQRLQLEALRSIDAPARSEPSRTSLSAPPDDCRYDRILAKYGVSVPAHCAR